MPPDALCFQIWLFAAAWDADRSAVHCPYGVRCGVTADHNRWILRERTEYFAKRKDGDRPTCGGSSSFPPGSSLLGHRLFGMGIASLPLVDPIMRFRASSPRVPLDNMRINLHRAAGRESDFAGAFAWASTHHRRPACRTVRIENWLEVVRERRICYRRFGRGRMIGRTMPAHLYR